MSLTIAIPKGRLGSQAIEMLKAAGIGESIDEKSRKLVFDDEQRNLRFMLLKNSDIITYVENGVADIGISGKDMIMENSADIYELYKMNIGKCKISVAGIKGKKIFKDDTIIKVATKFPETAKKYFNSKGQKIKIIKLNGSIELAPILGLSDVIVDIVETGNTLKANGLEVFEDMYPITAMVISNKISYKFKRKEIKEIIELIRKEDEKYGENN
ncbi:ATP phosphoribosyltransferase [bioreactor metagenome]|jgi:ATP phosphoribosyltransferase|uniref:ATP phosphoribosyltransferase n=2 Tax=root TaxID=1 RepID=A0A562JL99_9FIRM|nr:ATP phosphoribosyltransferase [Sedimentibacter saalensis]MEA5096073.1 ATP phosphoribosyltransferase [Sedimentibacter saalensis]TWH83970.1 ATP phosphoribosyltransferase [Sedimentibacter saalensis]